MIAARVDAPPEALAVLATDPDPEIRKLAASRRILTARGSPSSETLAAMTASPNPYERLAAANDASTPTDALAVLTRDAHPHVESAARRQLRERFPDSRQPPRRSVCNKRVRGHDQRCEMGSGHNGACWHSRFGPSLGRGERKAMHAAREENEARVEQMTENAQGGFDGMDFSESLRKDPVPGGPAPADQPVDGVLHDLPRTGRGVRGDGVEPDTATGIAASGSGRGGGWDQPAAGFASCDGTAAWAAVGCVGAARRVGRGCGLWRCPFARCAGPSRRTCADHHRGGRGLWGCAQARRRHLHASPAPRRAVSARPGTDDPAEHPVTRSLGVCWYLGPCTPSRGFGGPALFGGFPSSRVLVGGPAPSRRCGG